MTDAKQPLKLRHVVWLLAGLALVAAPHVERLPWWLIGLVVTLSAWRVYLGHASLPLPGRWLLILVVIGATAGVYFNYRTIFGRDAGVALLVMMLALKLLETRVLRDGMLLIFLGYFLIITNFLYSQTITTGLYMLACTWVITTTMIGLHYSRREPPLTARFRAAGVLLAQSTPLMLVLFLLFPRVTGPLWGLPQDAYGGASGLSDTMTPGSLSNLILSDAVAFRVTFDGNVPPPKQLYWRGPVMWDFDGRTWMAPRALYGTPEFVAHSPPVSYEVTLEPHNKRWLFALDVPGKVPPRAFASADFQLYAVQPVNNRVRYEMTSFLDYSYGQAEDGIAIRRALALPAEANPRTAAFARELRAQHADDRALVQAVLTKFRTERFVYTLTPPLLVTPDTVDEFLFATRSGFCEHYSSAFAVLMRAAGIPARVVTGYQGGEVNVLGNYLIVRQAEAHAWTEVWLKNEGWLRVDPTAAVSPLRVESGISAGVPRTDPLPLLVRAEFEALRQLRFTWDLVANTWNQWVLGYTPERQRMLLSRVGIDDATWYSLTVIMLCATVVIIIVLSAVMLRQLRSRVRDPVKIAYIRFCEKLQRAGLPRDPAEGPVAYSLRLAGARPDLEPGVTAITSLYVDLRYGSVPEGTGLQELRLRVKEFAA
jgi:transglutaminase-like putative cysteine protease